MIRAEVRQRPVRGTDRGRRGGRGRRAVRGEAHRTGVGQRQATGRERVRGLVGEALVEDRGRRLGVVGLAEVAPGGLAALMSEPPLQSLQRERGMQLVAAALAEDRADQRGDRDHVGQLPGLRRLSRRRVFERHQGWVELGRLDVRVDTGDVVLAVADQSRPGRSVQLRRPVDLGLEILLGVGGDLPLVLVRLDVGRRAADERRQVRAGGVAQHVHQEQAVLGTRVTGAEHQLGARVAVDVRDAVALVTDDRQPGLGVLDRSDVP